jgi:hypothetical protein
MTGSARYLDTATVHSWATVRTVMPRYGRLAGSPYVLAAAVHGHADERAAARQPAIVGVLISAGADGYAVPATPIKWPSGSVKWPTTRFVPGARSGPIRRVPPRLSAFWSAASTSGTPT